MADGNRGETSTLPSVCVGAEAERFPRPLLAPDLIDGQPEVSDHALVLCLNWTNDDLLIVAEAHSSANDLDAVHDWWRTAEEGAPAP
jgi:hypothetical protein